MSWQSFVSVTMYGEMEIQQYLSGPDWIAGLGELQGTLRCNKLDADENGNMDESEKRGYNGW